MFNIVKNIIFKTITGIILISFLNVLVNALHIFKVDPVMELTTWEFIWKSSLMGYIIGNISSILKIKLN